jgi:hypothetical protein
MLQIIDHSSDRGVLDYTYPLRTEFGDINLEALGNGNVEEEMDKTIVSYVSSVTMTLMTASVSGTRTPVK